MKILVKPIAALCALTTLSAISAQVYATEKVTSAITLENGATYLFYKNGKYAKTSKGKTKFDKGYPTRMPGGWKGLPKNWYSGINAATSYKNGISYMFKDSKYARLQGVGVIKNYPAKMPGGWKNMPKKWAGNVDAALFYKPSRKFYMFKGNQYVRLSGVKVDRGYPAKLPGGWKGMPAEFAKGIDAATYRGGHVYMIKGDKYIRFTGTKMDKGYPKLMSAWLKDNLVSGNTTKSTTKQTTKQTTKSFTVTFSNVGSLPVKLVKLDTKTGQPLTDVSPVKVESDLSRKIGNTKVGDIFKVYIIDNGKEIDGMHRKLFVSLPNETIYINGNKRLEDQKLNFTNLEQVDAEGNYSGVDIVEFNPKNVNGSISKKPIFENLQLDDVDYHTQSKKLLKRGLNYSDTLISTGSSKTRMVKGYGQFARAMSISVAGTFPLGKAPASGSVGFGYKEKESKSWSNTDVFAFSKEQKSIYKVDTDPEEARLHPKFIATVMKARTARDMKRIIAAYGTHYPKTVFYGGEYLTYMKFSEQQYTKLKSQSTNIKASIQQSTKGISKKSADKTTKTSEGGNGGSVGVTFGESSVQKDISRKTELKYRSVGGIGSFDNWDIDASSVVPIGVQLKPLDELINAKVFKNGSSAKELKKKRMVLARAIKTYIRKNSKKLKAAPMPKRYYNITLVNMDVTQEVDDLNKNTRGDVSITPWTRQSNGKKGRNIKTYWTDGKKGGWRRFWDQPKYSLAFRNVKGDAPKVVNKTISLSVPATKLVMKNGKKVYQYPSMFAQLRTYMNEKDDCCGDETYKAEKFIWLDDPDAQDLEIVNLDAKAFRTHAEKGTFRMRFKIMRMPDDFEDFSLGIF